MLKKFYDCFKKGDAQGMLALCPDEMTFQIPGKSPLAGKYTKATLAGQLLNRIHELSGGSFELEVHDITATEQHGLVLTTDRLMRNGTKHEYRSVHVWRIQNGKPIAWYEYPRDLYQYDAIWS